MFSSIKSILNAMEFVHHQNDDGCDDDDDVDDFNALVE